MPTHAGPWITPPTQTRTGSPTSPHFVGGSVTNLVETGNITDTNALNGVNPATLTTRAGSGGSSFTPRDDPTFQNPVIGASLWLIARAAVHGVDYLPTWPSNAIAIEYDPTDLDDTAWVHWPITVALSASPITATFPGGASATPPSDAAELLKRMAASDYTVTDDGFGDLTVTPTTANNWYTPALLGARTNVASFPVAGGTSSFTLDTTDLDTGNCAAFGECLNYIANGIVPTVQIQGGIDVELTYTYQPRRYRFIYPALAPLRQFPRDDGLGGSPRQGKTNGPTSVQGSTRQGWRGTYR